MTDVADVKAALGAQYMLGHWRMRPLLNCVEHAFTNKVQRCVLLFLLVLLHVTERFNFFV